MGGLTALAVVVVAYTLVASKLDRWWITGPMVFVAAGVILGPGGLASAFHVGVVAVAWAAVGWGERRPGTSRVAAGGAVPAAGRLGWLAGSVA
jgi:hypothetical protein